MRGPIQGPDPTIEGIAAPPAGILEAMHLSAGQWIALIVGTAALVALAFTQSWLIPPFFAVCIIALAASRLVP